MGRKGEQKFLAGILTPDQARRLRQIQLQRQGGLAFD
jgi:hypothetical protein